MGVPTYYVPFVTDNNERNPALQYQGQWDVSTNVENRTKLKHRSLVGTGSGQVRVVAPPTTTFLVVNGTAGPEYGTLIVEWENKSKPQPALESLWGAAGNATRPYIATNQLLYYAALDPSVSNYTLRLGADTVKGRIGLHSITFYSAAARWVSISLMLTSPAQTGHRLRSSQQTSSPAASETISPTCRESSKARRLVEGEMVPTGRPTRTVHPRPTSERLLAVW